MLARMNAPNRVFKFLPELWPVVTQLGCLALYVLAVRDFYRGSGDLFYPFFEGCTIAMAFGFPVVGLVQLIFGVIRYRQSRHRRYLLHVGSFAGIVVVTAGFFLLLKAGFYPTV